MNKLLACGLLAWAGVASAADQDGKPIPFDFSARVSVDETGAPQQIQFSDKLPKGFQSLAEQRIRQWHFEPARVDGVAKAGVTHVFVNACAVPKADGGMRISMGYRANGPGLPDLAPTMMKAPQYPGAAVRGGLQGELRLILGIGVDGRASVDSIESDGSHRFRQAFEPALRSWATTLRFIPEEVDGKPVVTHVRIPVSFNLGDGTRHEPERENRDECLAARGAGGNAPQPVVLDSPFKPITTS